MLNFIGKKKCDQPDTGPNVDQDSSPPALAQEENVAGIGDVGVHASRGRLAIRVSSELQSAEQPALHEDKPEIIRACRGTPAAAHPLAGCVESGGGHAPPRDQPCPVSRKRASASGPCEAL